jgi:hypothetical protein
MPRDDKKVNENRMIPAEIITLEGDRDGIRFGIVHFGDGCSRRFHADLLNGTVRLYSREDPTMKPAADIDLRRIASATQAVAEWLSKRKPTRSPA